jgi:hypothetical protein
VLTAEWGPAVAKNPFLQFTVKGAKAGDKIAITWKDNRGETRYRRSDRRLTRAGRHNKRGDKTMRTPSLLAALVLCGVR